MPKLRLYDMCEAIAHVMKPQSEIRAHILLTYAGWALQPKHHPLVLLAGGGLYWSMMKYRFPLSAAIDVAKFKTDKRDIRLQLMTTTKRIDNNPISTTNVYGVVLCMNV